MALRAAVYGEFNYRRDQGGLSTDQSFALFAARLGGFVDELVLVGRLDPEPGRTHHALDGDFAFVALPDYPSLAHLTAALRAALASVPALWRVAGRVDAVWLLGPNPLAVVFALIAGLRGCRVVLGVRQDIVALTRTRHRSRVLNAAARALESTWRLLARRLAVVTVGDDLAARYAASREVVPISVSLVEDSGIATAEAALRRDFSGELRVLSVGRLEPQKNPLILADVIAILRERDPRWRLVVCGSGSLESDLAERIAELEVSGAADLRGYVPVEAGLAELYRDCHLFLHVSRTEGFPQVLIEAFAAGLPTVATAVGGVGAWASGGARLVGPDDARAAADALEELASDADARESVVRTALEIAREHTAAVQCARVAALLRG